jgi:hypothetical protein
VRWYGLSAQRYGDRLRGHTAAGALRMTSTGLLTTSGAGTSVRRHDFYGQHDGQRTDPRG